MAILLIILLFGLAIVTAGRVFSQFPTAEEQLAKALDNKEPKTEEIDDPALE